MRVFYTFNLEYSILDLTTVNLEQYHAIKSCRCGQISINEKKDRHEETFFRKLSSWRWRVAYLALFGMITQIMHRNCISFALVCMCKGAKANTTVPHSHSENERLSIYSMSNNILWDSTTQSLILSAYFYGQLVSPFISGQVSLRFGIKWPMAIYMLLSTVLLVLTPSIARTSSHLLIGIRAVQGFLGSGCLPMFSQLWDEWSPKSERSELLAFTFSGLDLGVVIAFASSGYLCTIPVDGGWPFIFYTYGGVTVIWLVVWLIFVTDSPTSHRWISAQETTYIIGDRHDNFKEKCRYEHTKIQAPWLLILKSGPVWAMITAMLTVAYGMTAVFSYLPKYMNDVYKLNTGDNGKMSALPFLGRSLSIISIGLIADKILQWNRISVTNLRKIIQCLSSFIGAIFIFFIKYVNQSDMAILLLTISSMALGGTMSGSYTNALELAPRFASSLSGLAFTINALGQITAPMITSFMIKEDSDDSWRNVFLSLACVYCFGGIIYGLFGSSDELPWYTRMEEECEFKKIPSISSTVAGTEYMGKAQITEAVFTKDKMKQNKEYRISNDV
ncbi:uncharacterized transporter slc-17.2-like [Saccostrea echinata]|uniref:uncharacterized transporter slc-17.2-like n=1 Tax=Saccostrea echinata TaxID=191078 RepID=UPI002A839C32|nr:uncharacterized transporter slc-17.2-like [Saccostrea echinata]